MDLNTTVLAGNLHWPSALFARSALRGRPATVKATRKTSKEDRMSDGRIKVNSQTIAKHKKLEKPHFETENDNKTKKMQMNKNMAFGGAIAGEASILNTTAANASDSLSESVDTMEAEKSRGKRVPVKTMDFTGNTGDSENEDSEKDSEDEECLARKEKVNVLGATIITVLVSAVVFIAILAWSEVIRSWYDNTFVIDTGSMDLVYGRFWYAIFITVIAIIVTYAVYRYFMDDWSTPFF